MAADAAAILERLRNSILSLGGGIREEKRPHRLAYFVGGFQLFGDLMPLHQKVQVTVYVKQKGGPPKPTRVDVTAEDSQSVERAISLIEGAWKSYSETKAPTSTSS